MVVCPKREKLETVFRAGEQHAVDAHAKIADKKLSPLANVSMS